MAKPAWLAERTDFLMARLGDHGLVIEPAIAREIISNRLAELSEAMGISTTTAKKYVSDDVIEEIAVEIADEMVFEASGVDLMAASRSASLSSLLVGRTVSALAEAVLFFQQHSEIHASGDRIRELAEHLSIFGAMIVDSSPSLASVRVPPEFLTRIAGRLDAAAAEPATPEPLTVAWRRDAMRLRANM